MKASVPSAAIRASLSAISRVWKSTGPEFLLEEIDDSTVLLQGDFLITVVFHLRETAQSSPLYEAMMRAQEKQEEQKRKEEENAAGALPKSMTLEDALSLISPSYDEDDDNEDDAGKREEEDEEAERRKEVESSERRPPPPSHRPDVPPQLVVSFVVSMVGQQAGGQSNELLKFVDENAPVQSEKAGAPKSVCFELFGNGASGDG
jgi:hypothetical protein